MNNYSGISAGERPGGDARGSAILELALLLPFMTVLAFGSIEYAKIFRFKELVSVGIVEAGKLAFRNCYDTTQNDCEAVIDPLLTGTASRQETCLTLHAGAINEKLGKYVQSGALTLSINIYRWRRMMVDDGTGTDTMVDKGYTEWYATSYKDTTLTDPSRSNYYKGQDDDGVEQIKQIFPDNVMQEKEFLVVVEIFLRLPSTYGSFVGLPKEIELYDVGFF